MAYILAIVSQKGGVGKSALARLMAVEAAKGGLNVKIADLDVQQTTCVNWAARRADNGLEPNIRAEVFRNPETAIKEARNFDLYIIDGAPHSSPETLKACRAANTVVIPTSEGLDDLEPSVILANNLFKEGVPISNIVFALSITSNSAREIAGAREYLAQTPYRVLDGDIPFRIAFKGAMDKGKSVTEVPFPRLRQRADAMAQNIIDIIADNSKETP